MGKVNVEGNLEGRWSEMGRGGPGRGEENGRGRGVGGNEDKLGRLGMGT